MKHKKAHDTTEIFIHKARLVHGNRFLYANTVYSSSLEKLTIQCRRHGNITMRPNTHLTAGKGNCPYCSSDKARPNSNVVCLLSIGCLWFKLANTVSAAMTLDNDARETKTKVSVISTFEMPSSGLALKLKHVWHERFTEGGYKGDPFLSGRTGIRRVTETKEEMRAILLELRDEVLAYHDGLDLEDIEEDLEGKDFKPDFIARSSSVHKGVYLYDDVHYGDFKTPVLVTCRRHGNFKVLPDDHLKGGDCPDCTEELAMIKLNTANANFIRSADTVHRGKFCYKEVDFTHASKKVKIGCQLHGVFEMCPREHIKGYGCPGCAAFKLTMKSARPLSEYYPAMKDKHEGVYDYSAMIYHGARRHITIICKEHGRFTLTPHRHLEGAKCPGCNPNSRAPKRDATPPSGLKEWQGIEAIAVKKYDVNL